MKHLLGTTIVAVATSATTAFADTTATYATGDTSLADGKVLFEYDESDNITKLTMTPGADEKLILTGDSLPFAAGAQMVFPASGGGTNVIANPFTTAGALEFSGPTNMTGNTGSRGLNYNDFGTVFENVSLDDITPVAAVGASYFVADGAQQPEPFNIDRGETDGTNWVKFELQTLAPNGTVRGLYIVLKQSGDDIQGRILAARHTSGADKYGVRMFTNESGVTGWGYSSASGYTNYEKIYASDTSGNGFGISSLTIGPRYGTPKLTFAVSEDITLPAISGSGVEVTFDANAFNESDVAFTSGTLRCNSTWMTLTTEHTLSALTLRTGSIYGSYINSSDPVGKPAIVFGWENNGSAASCQLQQRDGNIVRGVDLEFRQNGDAVEVRWVQALYINDATNADSYYGKQKLTTSTPGIYTKANVPDRLTVNWLSTIANAATVKANGRNDMVGAFIVKGDASHPIVYDVAAKYAMPMTIDCYGNATLNFSASGRYNDGVSQNTETITMHEGTTIATAGDYPFHYNSGDVVLDGAALSHTTGDAYLNYLTFSNASAVNMTGGSIRAGYAASDPMWTVTGTGKSTYTGPLHFLAQGTGDNGTEKYLTIAVADTVEGEGTDFLLTGDITADLTRKNASFIKTGAGTMEVDGTIYTTNRVVRVEEGTLLLGRSNATAADVDFSLQGGTLAFAEGTANTVDAVALTADSEISVASGALLTMADLTIADGKVLNIVGDGKVRVLSALDTATRSRIRLNGRRVSQGSTGYLYIGGLIISFH